MNNKGQSLVAFVLLLPVITLLIGSLFEYGNILFFKQKCDMEIKDSIKYGLKNISDDDVSYKISLLLDENIDGKKDVTIFDDTIKIRLRASVNSLYSKSKKYDFDITYVGYNENGKIKIKRE